MSAHVSWETLNDVLDGRLAPADASVARQHLRDCASCAEQFAALSSLVRQARDTAVDVEPPAGAWVHVRGRIDATKQVRFPAAQRPERLMHVSTRRLLAAAVVLIALSSGVTAVMMRRSLTPATRPDVATTSSSAPATVRPASGVLSIEREYLSTADALRESLEEERSRLAPATIAAVERSLRVIDSAIVEARQALIRDPANAALREILRNNHQQKIDFLKRATALVQKV